MLNISKAEFFSGIFSSQNDVFYFSKQYFCVEWLYDIIISPTIVAINNTVSFTFSGKQYNGDVTGIDVVFKQFAQFIAPDRAMIACASSRIAQRHLYCVIHGVRITVP